MPNICLLAAGAAMTRTRTRRLHKCRQRPVHLEGARRVDGGRQVAGARDPGAQQDQGALGLERRRWGGRLRGAGGGRCVSWKRRRVDGGGAGAHNPVVRTRETRTRRWEPALVAHSATERYKPVSSAFRSEFPCSVRVKEGPHLSRFRLLPTGGTSQALAQRESAVFDVE